MSQEKERLLGLIQWHQDAIYRWCKRKPQLFWVPTLTVISSDDRRMTFVIGAKFQTAQERREVMVTAGRDLHQRQLPPEILLLSHQAWTSTRIDCPPRDDPDRQSAIGIFALHLRMKVSLFCALPMFRDEKNHITLGEAKEAIDCETPSFLLAMLDSYREASHQALQQRGAAPSTN